MEEENLLPFLVFFRKKYGLISFEQGGMLQKGKTMLVIIIKYQQLKI